MIKTLINILTSPKEAFDDLRENPTILFPLLLLLAAMASIQVGYFSLVDPEYMVEQLVAQAAAASGAPEDQLRQTYENLSVSVLMISSAVSVVVVLSVVLLLYAGYLTLMSKITDEGIGYRLWLSLSCWTAMPVLLTALAAWVVMLTSTNGEIGTTEVTPLSLNNLLFQHQGRFMSLLNSLDLTQIWSLVLLLLGYRQWTGKGTAASLIIVALPYALIYAIWGLVLL